MADVVVEGTEVVDDGTFAGVGQFNGRGRAMVTLASPGRAQSVRV
jgi:hypothetical protein